MTIYLNHVIEETSPLYGDSGCIHFARVRSIREGDSSNNTELSLPAHAGTHIDAPFHFDANGQCLDQFPADFWICRRPFLIEKPVEKDEIITLENWLLELEKIPEETDLLLIKTGFERFRHTFSATRDKTYIFNGPGLGPDVGLWLRRNRSLKMIGFDFISLTSYQHRELGREAHRAFLKTDSGKKDSVEPILIIEDMKLADLHSSPRRVSVVPINYQQADGSPVTVLAEIDLNP